MPLKIEVKRVRDDLFRLRWIWFPGEICQWGLAVASSIVPGSHIDTPSSVFWWFLPSKIPLFVRVRQSLVVLSFWSCTGICLAGLRTLYPPAWRKGFRDNSQTIGLPLDRSRFYNNNIKSASKRNIYTEPCFFVEIMNLLFVNLLRYLSSAKLG